MKFMAKNIVKNLRDPELGSHYIIGIIHERKNKDETISKLKTSPLLKLILRIETEKPQMEKKYLQKIFLIKDLHSLHKELSNNISNKKPDEIVKEVMSQKTM